MSACGSIKVFGQNNDNARRGERFFLNKTAEYSEICSPAGREIFQAAGKAGARFCKYRLAIAGATR